MKPRNVIAATTACGKDELDQLLPAVRQIKEVQSNDKPAVSEETVASVGALAAAAEVSKTVEEWLHRTAHGAYSEAVSIMLSSLFGGTGVDAAVLLLAQTSSALGSAAKLPTVLQLVDALHPTNGIQALLAAQMVGIHGASMQALLRLQACASREAQESEVNQSTRLMRLFAQQSELYSRLQGTIAQQKVVVERVDVQAGGQAAVGILETRGGG